MKVLFVCTQNRGRSQIAAELYNLYTKSHDADSVGTVVDTPHKSLAERAKTSSGALNVIAVMREEGVDVSDNLQTPLRPEMLQDYDKVIVMAEDHTIPDYLRQSVKFEYWPIEDPYQKSLDGTRETRELIKHRVLELIKR